MDYHYIGVEFVPESLFFPVNLIHEILIFNKEFNKDFSAAYTKGLVAKKAN